MKDNSFRVLVIEDDAEHSLLLCHQLKRATTRYEVTSAQSLAEACRALESNSFDIVLSDLALPDSRSNEETVQQVLASCDNAALIILTSIDDEELGRELRALGVHDYIPKGLENPRGLDRAIRHAVSLVQNQSLLTAVQEREARLSEQNKRLKKLCDQAHEFVDTVSHEFRTPLTVIKEYASLLREGIIGEVSDEQQRLLNVVEDRAEDLNVMVDDMLDVSKLKAGLLSVRRLTCNVNDIFSRVTDSLDRKAKLRAVSLQWNIDDDLPNVICDAEKASRVVTNLATNAIKFCGDPGKVEITAAPDYSSQDLVITVTDNGEGMEPEEIAMIFSRFEQLDNNTQQSTKGFGLGLSIALQLAELNLGCIEVTSCVGRGSTFSFRLPLANQPEVVRRHLAGISKTQATQSVEVGVVSWPNPASVANQDLTMFLGRCLRKDELLVEVDAQRMLVILNGDQRTLDEWIEHVETEEVRVNRNRPRGSLPSISSEHLGDFDVASESEEVVEQVALCCKLEGELV